MDERKRFDVIIGGELLTLIASESEEYINKLVAYINERIVEIQKGRSSAKMTSYTKILLVLINIADDFFKEQGKNATVKHDLATARKKLNENVNEIAQLKDENNILKNRLADLEKQLEQSKKDLMEYVETFDIRAKQ